VRFFGIRKILKVFKIIKENDMENDMAGLRYNKEEA